MKILLVDNNTKHKNALLEALAGHEVEVVFYNPLLKFNYQAKDLVILSGGGGEGNEIDDLGPNGDPWYKNEMKFIRECNKPIVGICMGFEIICRAYGEKVEEMEEIIKGFKKLVVTEDGIELLPGQRLKQYEAHKWRVQKVSKNDFDILAESETGIEMIKHRRKPIIATQFHPEVKGGTIKLQDLISAV